MSVRAMAGGKAKGMGADAFGDLVAGMRDVLAFERGKRRGYAVHTAQNIKAIYAETKLPSSRQVQSGN